MLDEANHRCLIGYFCLPKCVFFANGNCFALLPGVFLPDNLEVSSQEQFSDIKLALGGATRLPEDGVLEVFLPTKKSLQAATLEDGKFAVYRVEVLCLYSVV